MDNNIIYNSINDSLKNVYENVGEYYVEYDEDTNSWCVFHTDKLGPNGEQGYAFGSHSTKEQAEEHAKKLNESLNDVYEHWYLKDEPDENIINAVSTVVDYMGGENITRKSIKFNYPGKSSFKITVQKLNQDY